MSVSGEYRLPLRVYIEDTDAGGIVYYVNYLKFMERARTEFLRQLGFDKIAILDDNKMLVVHSLSSNYRLPARLDQLLTVTAKVIKLQRAAITFQQKVYRDDELLCEGEVKIACVLSDTLRPRAPLKNMVMSLRDLKRAAVRRSAKVMAIVLGENCNEADECFRARPLGRSARSALCVASSRQVQTCLRICALIANRAERQRQYLVNQMCPQRYPMQCAMP